MPRDVSGFLCAALRAAILSIPWTSSAGFCRPDIQLYQQPWSRIYNKRGSCRCPSDTFGSSSWSWQFTCFSLSFLIHTKNFTTIRALLYDMQTSLIQKYNWLPPTKPATSHHCTKNTGTMKTEFPIGIWRPTEKQAIDTFTSQAMHLVQVGETSCKSWCLVHCWLLVQVAGKSVAFCFYLKTNWNRHWQVCLGWIYLE